MADFAENWNRFKEWWKDADKVERYELFLSAFGAQLAYELLDLLEVQAWEVACWFTTRQLYELFDALPDGNGKITGLR